MMSDTLRRNDGHGVARTHRRSGGRRWNWPVPPGCRRRVKWSRVQMEVGGNVMIEPRGRGIFRLVWADYCCLLGLIK
jgi:hypothetical protein